jgi:hypothetical protein
MNLMKYNHTNNYIFKVTLSLSVEQYISSTSAWLMHDAMNNASSHKVNLNQFRMKASYMVT